MKWKSFISSSCFVLSLASWAAFLVWFSTELWVPLVFGDSGYHLKDGRGTSFLITIGVALSASVFTVGIFVPAIISVIAGRIENFITLMNGQQATATVVAIGPNSTGFNVETNEQPLLGLTLQIDTGRSTPYTVNVDVTIPEYEIPQYQPGTAVNIIVNKRNPKKVVVVGLAK